MAWYSSPHSITPLNGIAPMTTLRLHQITARENRALFERLVTHLRETMMRRAARKALMQLDDRSLKDIGLSRSSLMSDLF